MTFNFETVEDEKENLFEDDEDLKKIDEGIARRAREKKNRAFVGYRAGRVCACCKYFISAKCECVLLAEYSEPNFAVSEYGICKNFEREEND